MIHARMVFPVVLTIFGSLAVPFAVHGATPSGLSGAASLQRYALTASDVGAVFGGRFVKRTADTHGAKGQGLLGVYVVSFTPLKINGTTGTVVSGVAQTVDRAHAHAAYSSTLPHNVGVVSQGSSTHVSKVRGIGDEANMIRATTLGLGSVGKFRMLSVTFRRGVYAGIVAVIYGRSIDSSKVEALAKIMAQRVP